MTSGQLDEERIFHLARGISDAVLRAEYLDQICVRASTMIKALLGAMIQGRRTA